MQQDYCQSAVMSIRKNDATETRFCKKGCGQNTNVVGKVQNTWWNKNIFAAYIR